LMEQFMEKSIESMMKRNFMMDKFFENMLGNQAKKEMNQMMKDALKEGGVEESEE